MSSAFSNFQHVGPLFQICNSSRLTASFLIPSNVILLDFLFVPFVRETLWVSSWSPSRWTLFYCLEKVLVSSCPTGLSKPLQLLPFYCFHNRNILTSSFTHYVLIWLFVGTLFPLRSAGRTYRSTSSLQIDQSAGSD